jgi:predicted GIY-YIG superfamily endonuclease
MKDYWYLYICKARTGRLYTGIAKSPEKRLIQHNNKTGSQFARDQGPFELVYISPPFSSKTSARLREIQVKGWARSKKEKLISGEWV